MVAKHDQKTAVEEGGKKKLATKADKSKKPATAKQLKPKPMSLESFQAQGQAHVSDVAIREPVSEATRPLPVVEDKGKAIATEEQAAQLLLALHTPKRRSATDQFIFQRRTSVTEEASTRPSTQPQDDASANIVPDSLSPADAETGADTDKTNSGGDTEILQIGEEQGEDVANMVDLEERTVEINEGQAGSDLGKTPESRPPPEHVLVKEDQAVADVHDIVFEVYDHLILSAFVFGVEYSICSLIVIMERKGILHAMLRL
ncbi:hypothetical protein Tco_1061877 [Tanacetum coccineum]